MDNVVSMRGAWISVIVVAADTRSYASRNGWAVINTSLCANYSVAFQNGTVSAHDMSPSVAKQRGETHRHVGPQLQAYADGSVYRPQI